MQMDFICEWSPLFRDVYSANEIEVNELMPPELDITIEQLGYYIETLKLLHTQQKPLIFVLMSNKQPFPALDNYTKQQMEDMLTICNYLLLPEQLTKQLTIGIDVLAIIPVTGETIHLPESLHQYMAQKFPRMNKILDIKNAEIWALLGELDGLVHAMSYVQEIGTIECAMEGALLSGSIDCAKYVYTFGPRVSAQAYSKAAMGGNLDCLQWLYENKCPWNTYACSSAALFGHLECLQWLHKHGAPWNELTCSNAASRGHIDCLKYAHKNNCPWNSNTCVQAALFDYIDCLKYAHENGAPWNEDTCLYSAQKGNIQCLQYVLEHNCPIPENIIYITIVSGKLECLQILLKHGVRYNIHYIDAHMKRCSRNMYNSQLWKCYDYFKSCT